MEILSTILIAIVPSIVSSIVTYLLTRRKYNSEVDNNLIANMKQSLDFYKQLSDDNKERLEEVLKRNDALEKEVAELRKHILGMMTQICMDLTCKVRQREFLDSKNYGNNNN